MAFFSRVWTKRISSFFLWINKLCKLQFPKLLHPSLIVAKTTVAYITGQSFVYLGSHFSIWKRNPERDNMPTTNYATISQSQIRPNYRHIRLCNDTFKKQGNMVIHWINIRLPSQCSNYNIGYRTHLQCTEHLI